MDYLKMTKLKHQIRHGYYLWNPVYNEDVHLQTVVNSVITILSELRRSTPGNYPII